MTLRVINKNMHRWQFVRGRYDKWYIWASTLIDSDLTYPIKLQYPIIALCCKYTRTEKPKIKIRVGLGWPEPKPTYSVSFCYFTKMVHSRPLFCFPLFYTTQIKFKLIKVYKSLPNVLGNGAPYRFRWDPTYDRLD